MLVSRDNFLLQTMKVLVCLALLLCSSYIESRPQSPQVTTTETKVVTFTNVQNSKPVLNGLTLEFEPYVRLTRTRKLGQSPFEGYLIDLLDAITNQTSFGYSLKLDTSQGFKNHADLLKQVEDKNFDFALADLTVNEERKKAMDFSEPFLNITLSAIVRKIDHAGHKTLKEVIEATEANADMKYAIIGGGATAQYLASSTNPLAVKIWKKIALVNSTKDAYAKVRAGNHIFLGETPRAEYIQARECDLKALPDSDNSLDDHNRQQAIAWKKGMDKELGEINAAIKKLNTDGTLDKLYNKYWKDNVVCRISITKPLL